MKNKQEQREPLKFTGGQILKSKAYRNRRDLVSVVLSEEESYTLEEADKKIDDFMKGRVN